MHLLNPAFRIFGDRWLYFLDVGSAFVGISAVNLNLKEIRIVLQQKHMFVCF